MDDSNNDTQFHFKRVNVSHFSLTLVEQRVKTKWVCAIGIFSHKLIVLSSMIATSKKIPGNGKEIIVNQSTIASKKS